MVRDTDEDLRVAFLLFDSAAEILLYRRALMHVRMGMFDAPQDVWGSPRIINVDLRDVTQKAAAAAESDVYVRWVLSASQKRSIAREFDSKLRFLAWDGQIPAEFVSILSRLHHYRNEMYHREESRPEALRTVVHLYAWFVAELLERLAPMSTGWSSSDPEDLLARTYARMGQSPPETSGLSDLPDGRSMQADMAQSLRNDLNLTGGPDLLADYVASRLKRTHTQLRFVAEYLETFHELTALTEWDVIRVLYANDVTEKFTVYAETKVVDPRTTVQRQIPVTRADLDRWDTWRERIAGQANPVDAFRSLAELELEYEDFETKVAEMAYQADSDIQHRWDLYRGK